MPHPVNAARSVMPTNGPDAVNRAALNAAGVRGARAMDAMEQLVHSASHLQHEIPKTPDGEASAVQRTSAGLAPTPSITDSPVVHDRARELASLVLAHTEPQVEHELTAKESADAEAEERQREEPIDQFKYGKIYFEETGRTAQYLIVPEHHKAEDIVTNVAKFMRAPSASIDGQSNSSGDRMICKPSILFEVRARGRLFMDEAKDVIDNDYLHKQWFGSPDDQVMDEDQMVRKFSDRTLDVFKDVVKGVANADGWFMNSAGRGASHQLVGDCIDTFDALEDTTWVNFASLANPNLFAAKDGAGQDHPETGVELHGKDLHSYLVKELRRRAVPIPTQPEPDEKEIRLPIGELEKRGAVQYAKPKVPFPKLADLQGSKPDQLLPWLENEMDKLGDEKEMHLHPRATHFIFFEEKGFSKDGGQLLPWNKVDDFREELTNKQGTAEGLLLLSGDQKDFNRAAAFIAKSNPVISFKTCGGASELLSRMIDLRHERDRLQTKQRLRPKTAAVKPQSRFDLCIVDNGTDVEAPQAPRLAKKDEMQFPRGPHDEAALLGGAFGDASKDGRLASNVFFEGAIERAVPEELIVIDLHPENKRAGVQVQMQLAEMLTMIGGDEERQLGFKPAERQSMAKAWDHSIRFERNAKREKLQADIFSYLMLLMALLLVCTVVLKQAAYPPRPKADACGHLLDAGQQIQHTTPREWLPVLRKFLLVMPILNGLLLTIQTKFNPYKKYVIYKWASEHCVSETYKYRARATPYNVVATSDSWLLDDNGRPNRKPLAKRFTDNMKGILDTVMADSTVSESSIQFERDENSMDQLREQHLQQLADNEHVKKQKETDDYTDLPGVEDYTDDGYSQLTVHDYIACRTIPQHRLIQEKLPELNTQKSSLQVLMYVMSAVSVMLATLNMDLYIAISTSAISMLSGILEYQKLETRVASLNRALKDLTQILHDWDSYTFVERRKLHVKNEIVRRTEAAVMLEIDMFYGMATGGSGEAEDKDDGGEHDGEDGKTPEKKK